jgi:hypothetical protein
VAVQPLPLGGHGQQRSQVVVAAVLPRGGADSLPFGGRTLHPSHVLTFWDNVQVWACDGCGHYARGHARGLALPCAPPKEHGRATLSLLRRGGMPGDRAAALAHNRFVIRRRGPLTRPRARPAPRRRCEGRTGRQPEAEAPTRPTAEDDEDAEEVAADSTSAPAEPAAAEEPAPAAVAPPPAVARRCGRFRW